MARIRILNERLINKIAAGEVVERPSSALKELLENSFDASASELRIELEAGGKRLIKVIDNGTGMDEDDLLLALERHATSKIKEFEDLEQVATLGFRGEAIPSIAAVSRFTIRSRHHEADSGHEAVVEGGIIKSIQPVAMAPGTTVEVRGLFHNVPARKKFLRTTSTELAHCQTVVLNYAIAFPEANVRFSHNGRELIVATPTESVRDRIASIVGNHLLDRLIPFEGRDDEYGIVGFVSEPTLTRADTSLLHFYVNRRVIRDKLLIHAVRAAYADLLPKGRTPAAFLFLELPARDVDVNVHPAKTEVRFRDSSRVHTLVVEAVRSALSGQQPFAPMAPELQPRRRIYPLHKDVGGTEHEQRAIAGSLQKSLDAESGKQKMTFIGSRDVYHGSSVESADNHTPESGPVIQRFARTTLDDRYAETVRFSGSSIDIDSIVPLGQVQNSYIVASFRGGLLLIDQHAAHERVLFEQLQKAARSQPQSQGLLHPVMIDLPPFQSKLVEEFAPALSQIGFNVEPFGPASVSLRGIPATLEVDRAQEIFVNIASDIERIGKRIDPEKLIKELVLSASCHGAIKVNTSLNRQKMNWLIDSLFNCEMPMRCPHGRPVVLTIAESELRHRFGRS